MSTRKTTTVVEESPPELEGVTLIESAADDETAELEQLEGVVSEFTGAPDTSINVYRQGQGKTLSFLFRTSPDEMSGGEIMERTRDLYGSGDYRVHIRQRSRIVHNRPFSVEEVRKPDPATQPPPGTIGVAEILAVMQAQQDRTLQMFTQTMQSFGEALRGGNQPAFNPIEMQTALMQSLAALKQMTEKPDDSQGAVQMLIQGLTLAKDLQPRDGETNTSDILLKALDTFGPTIAAASSRGAPAPGQSAPGLPGPNGQPQLDDQARKDAEAERAKNMQQVALRQQLAWLIKQAAAGKNPDLYAELLLDQIGETAVLEFVGKPDALDRLIALDGNVALYKPWFEALKAAILELTRPEATGETGQQDVIVSSAEPHAVQFPASEGNATGDTIGAGGDAPNA